MSDLEKSLQIKITIAGKEGRFEVYAKTLEDVERFAKFLQESTQAVIRKTREDMEKEGYRKVQ